MKKNLVTTVLFILVIVILAGILWESVRTIIKNTELEKQEELLNCVQEVKLEILDVCYEGNLLKMKLKNKKDTILGDFFLIQMTYEDGNVETIPTAYHTYLNAYETKQIIVPYYEGVVKIKVIPKIENQVYLCVESAPEFENIGECENEA